MSARHGGAITFAAVSITLIGLVGIALSSQPGRQAPRFWNDRELADWATPIAALDVRPSHFSEREYYAAPENEWVRTYPVYFRGREPEGFWDVLRAKGPERLITPGARTQAEWIESGRRVFEEMDVPVFRSTDPQIFYRMSDDQLFALAEYLFSLEPPPNPHAGDPRASAGREVFQREGCASCHTPPLYSNNKLTLAQGYQPPPDHPNRTDVMPLSVGTDPNLALKTRMGTGFYKVPSLKGVWYRGMFNHDGSVTTLQEWFDPARLRHDFVPSGFLGYHVTRRAVPGHEFGLRLTAVDKGALIAFLNTL